jgi:hypothetical protein
LAGSVIPGPRMHPVLRFVISLGSVLLAGFTAQAKTLTIVTDFEGPHTPASIALMKKEFAGIMKDSGLNVEWLLPQEANETAVDNLVVVRFKGKCILEPVGYLYDERGPLAFTATSKGEVLPFSEVACDQVTSVMRSAMFGGDYNRADALLGRALARVVAHEVIHILTNSGEHGREGIARPAFSGRQLIEGTLPLMPEDLKRIQADHP